MKALLKKEFSLCLHPAALLFVLLGAFPLIPNYPYEVMFFFSGLGAFFICLTGRENGDLPFTCALPVAKKMIPLARILLCVILQTAQLLVCAAFVAIKELVIQSPNAAGMDANLALLGEGLIINGVFNLIYFPLYFRRPTKVGVPFLIASVAVFLLIGVSIASCYIVPVFQMLDTLDPLNMGMKGIFFAVGLGIDCLMTAGACLLSQRAFVRVDL